MCEVLAWVRGFYSPLANEKGELYRAFACSFLQFTPSFLSEFLMCLSLCPNKRLNVRQYSTVQYVQVRAL
jgi:hypothetical protein